MRVVHVLAVPAFVAAAAFADVDLSVHNGDKVSGTFDPGFESETFRVKPPRDASLTIAAKGRKPKGAPVGPAPRIRLFDPDGAEVAIGLPLDTPKGTRLAGFAIAKSGVHRVVVASEGGVEGDYQLQVAWKSPRKQSVEGVAGPADATFTVSGEKGAVVAIDVAPDRGSSALPWIPQIEGPGFEQAFAQPAASARRVRVTTARLPDTMDLTVTVRDQGGGGGGAFVAKVSVKAPKPSKRKVDISAKSLTFEANGDSTLRGGVVGPEGGLVGVVDEGSGIDGASVNVPADALATPTTVYVGTGEPIPGADGLAATGPTIVFGPDGTKFAEDVTITIPFDPALLADGDASEIQVFTRDKQGRVSQVEGPFTVDAVAGTVSFPSSHFSEYRAFGPPRVSPRDITGDGFDDLILATPYELQGRGAVYVFPGRANMDGGKLSDAPIAISGTNPVVGQTPGDTFGASVATGDVNADGVADLVVGATRADGQGAVYVFFGGFSIRATAANANAKLTPSSSDLRFGATVVVADATGDGVADVLVGAPYSTPVEFEEGAVYLFPGGAGFSTMSADDSNVLAIHGEASGDRLGLAVAVGDVTGDGKPDIVAGSDGSGVEGAGKAHLFQDPTSFVSPAVAGVDGTTLRGSASGDQFGAALAIGDLDQDGTADLAVGAPGVDYVPYASQVVEYDAGAVFVFKGSPAFADRDAGSADFKVTGFSPTAGDLLGSSIVAANALGDAAPDLLLGVPGDDERASDGGALIVVRGDTTFGTNFSLQFGEQLRDRLGVVLDPADLNGDGRLDTIVVLTGANSNAGLVRVFLGPGIFGRSFDITGAPGVGLGQRDVAPDLTFKR